MDTPAQRLYHGSKVGGLRRLEPRNHPLFPRPVVFASSDIRFALAMVHGTGDELAVGYTGPAGAVRLEMYLDELQPDKLQLLDQPGWLYTVDPAGFEGHPKLAHCELVKAEPAAVIQQVRIDNILAEFRKYEIDIVGYDQVPEKMRQRGLSPQP